MHLFSCPEHAGERSVCLDRIPKKLRERLQVSQETGIDVGWGLQLEEGWNQKKVWCCAFLVFGIGSGVGLVLCKVFEHSIQDAFAVAAYMVAVVTLSIGFTQAMCHDAI